MAIIEYQTQEQLDDAFEEEMERRQSIAFLEAEIEDLRREIEDAENQIAEKEQEIIELEELIND